MRDTRAHQAPMDELVKLVVAQTGIPEDKARMAVDLVVQQLKGYLPAPLASQLEAALGSGASTPGGGTVLGGGLGDMLGKLG